MWPRNQGGGANLFLIFLVTLGLCTVGFLECGERGLLFITMCGLLIAVASLAVEHGL